MRYRPFLLMMCTLLAVSGAEVQRYATRLDLGPDGRGAATATVSVLGGPGEVLTLPVGFKASGFLLKDAPAGLAAELQGRGVKVTLPPAGGASAFTFTFTADAVFAAETDGEGSKATVPPTSRFLRHAFVNTGASPVRDYAVEALLPEGYRFQAIKESTPKAGKTEVEPRVRLGRSGGRQTALLHATGLEQGGSASMVLEAVPVRRSLLWLLAGLAAAALYLYYFRDMTKSRA